MAQAAPLLKLSALPDEGASEQQRRYAPLVRYLSAELRQKVQFVTLPDYSSVAEALGRENAEIAMAAAREEDGQLRTQPVFCLLRADLLESLVAFTHEGGRKIDRWTGQHRCVVVPFDDSSAFFNANTADDLARLQASGGAG